MKNLFPTYRRWLPATVLSLSLFSTATLPPAANAEDHKMAMGMMDCKMPMDGKMSMGDKKMMPGMTGGMSMPEKSMMMHMMPMMSAADKKTMRHMTKAERKVCMEMCMKMGQKMCMMGQMDMSGNKPKAAPPAAQPPAVQPPAAQPSAPKKSMDGMDGMGK